MPLYLVWVMPVCGSDFVVVYFRVKGGIHYDVQIKYAGRPFLNKDA